MTNSSASEIELLSLALSQATRPRCEYGHDGISLNIEDGRPDCPVPEHDPKRIVDFEDASLVWEADTTSTSTSGHDDRIARGVLNG